LRKLVSIILTLCLGAFLADAVVSLLDDTLLLFFGNHILSAIRGILWFLAVVLAMVTYVLMGLTPMIPKRLFVPVTLFNPVALLLMIPVLIYHFDRNEWISWGISIGQVWLALSICRLVLGGWKFHWPLVAEASLGSRSFGWLNSAGFLMLNIFVLLPAVVLYLAFCASLAADHFSGGFLALRWNRITVQTRKYLGHDGKTIQLVPMIHIADFDFYQRISQSFPTNAVILLEGVTDSKNLLTNELSYKKTAASLGLVEQVEKFQPREQLSQRADIDVSQFSPATIVLLNQVILIHSKGLNAENLFQLLQNSSSPMLEKQLFEDLLTKRNQHLLQKIQAELPRSDIIIVPWGVAHMPGIAGEIQKSGFSLVQSREYDAILFRSVWNGLNSRQNETNGSKQRSLDPGRQEPEIR